ncbi:MAG: TIGR03986 family CRISPR-associated RAMP protein [Blastochloris sp.]|nr:TIGR03986 family CRISPR-associated RAMP protein [Blastochloris sp.]
MTITRFSQHHRSIPEERTALAPYNFVPLPTTVVEVDPETVREPFAAYDATRYTGRIDGVLTAESPLYVRGALTVDEVKDGLQAKDLPAFFATNREPESQGLPHPVIPGSSIRGMLRALVEIVSYAKVSRVTDRQHYFFRAVAAKMDDPLSRPYRAQLRDVRAGYLVRTSDGWAIRPALTFGKEGYLKVRERDVPKHLGLIRLNDRGYRPQYIPVSFTTKNTPKGRLVIDRIDHPKVYQINGMMVTSGNMLETDGGRGRGISPRKSHAVVGEPDMKAPLLAIDPQAVEDYKASLTDFQRGEGMGADGPFHPLDGLFATRDGRFAEGRPIFYCEPAKGKQVVFFGQSPNFRMPYRWPGSERAASPRDFVPPQLRSDTMIDIAEAIFGFVRGDRQREGQALAGRVFVSDAIAETYDWLANDPITPKILATPKPTTFQHYLVQPNPNKRDLRHYGSKPGDETVIRGHKLYWHKGNPGRAEIEDLDFLQEPDDKRKKDTQHTTIRPVAAGSRFRFELQFTNLSDIELGALLWVLRLSDDALHQDRPYRLKIGMGKPLGMGALKVEHKVCVSNRVKRYSSLFGSGQAWALAEDELSPEQADACVAAFEHYILANIDEREQTQAAGRLANTLRIQMLLAMLSWPGPQKTEQFTRYMEIELKRSPRIGKDTNEYKDRPVLPDPLQVQALAEGRPLPAVEDVEPDQPPEPPPPPKKPEVQAPEIPEIGKQFAGSILDVDETAMLIEIPGFPSDKALGVVEVEGLHKRFKVGNKARVEVISTRTQKSGRVIVALKLASRS